MKNKELLDNIMKIIGLEINEEFYINGISSIFHINDKYNIMNSSGPVNYSLVDILTEKITIRKRVVFTEEEKLIIDMLQDNGYHYIARDKLNLLYAYKKEPIKKGDLWSVNLNYIEEDSECFSLKFYLFKDIKWEDKEPFCIG